MSRLKNTAMAVKPNIRRGFLPIRSITKPLEERGRVIMQFLLTFLWLCVIKPDKKTNQKMKQYKRDYSMLRLLMGLMFTFNGIMLLPIWDCAFSQLHTSCWACHMPEEHEGYKHIFVLSIEATYCANFCNPLPKPSTHSAETCQFFRWHSPNLPHEDGLH